MSEHAPIPSDVTAPVHIDDILRVVAPVFVIAGVVLLFVALALPAASAQAHRERSGFAATGVVATTAGGVGLLATIAGWV